MKINVNKRKVGFKIEKKKNLKGKSQFLFIGTNSTDVTGSMTHIPNGKLSNIIRMWTISRRLIVIKINNLG